MHHWRRHVRELLGLVTLADFIQQEDRDALSDVVVWQDDPLGVSIYPGVALKRVVKAERAPAPLLALDEVPAVWPRRYTDVTHPAVLRTPNGRSRWPTRDVLGPALLYLCDTLNAAVRGRAHAKLMPFAHRGEKGVPLDFEADSLLTSLYLLLQLRVSQYDAPQDKLVDLRKCPGPGCKNHFLAHGNRKVCDDDACKKWLRQQRNLRYNLPKRAS
jgi:hypothetical protein